MKRRIGIFPPDRFLYRALWPRAYTGRATGEKAILMTGKRAG
jgi:hypothetical protein